MSTARPECVILPPPATHTHTVIWLHGLGADGHDFEPLVPELQLPPDHGIRFVFPHAPVRPVTLNGGMPMRAWYDIADTDIGRTTDAAGIRESVRTVADLITHEESAGISTANIVLAGFSQGGVIALHAGLHHPNTLGGIVGLSCYLPFVAELPDTQSPANRETPVFLAHGEADPVIPLALGEVAREAITAARAAPEWHTYPMAHAVCQEEIRDLRTWLLARTTATQ